MRQSILLVMTGSTLLWQWGGVLPAGGHSIAGVAAASAFTPQDGDTSAEPSESRQRSDTRPGRIGWGNREPLTAEQIDTALAILREFAPERADRMEDLRQSDPRAFERAMRASAGRILAFEALKAENKKLYDLRLRQLRVEAQANRTALKLLKLSEGADADAEQVATTRLQLVELVGQQINFNIESRGGEFLLMDEYLVKLRADLEHDAENMDEVIAERFKIALARAQQRAERRRDRERAAAERQAAPDADRAEASQPSARPDQSREPLTSKQIKTALEILREFAPDRADRLEELRQKNAGAFERAMRMTARRVLALEELKRKAPELYKTRLKELRVEAQANRTALELLEARQAQGPDAPSAKDIEDLEQQLTALVGRQVNFNIKARGDELVLLEKHLKKLRKDLLHDSGNLDQVVKDRVEAVLAKGRQRIERLNELHQRSGEPQSVPVRDGP